MTEKAIADALSYECRENWAAENLDRLYAAKAVSVEAGDQGTGRVNVGFLEITGKLA
ncbi:MAG: hypothetical protein JJ897_10505 [Marinibacterium sp.]|nr:hypothetical protein [Marinibacterium sp.]